MSKAVLWWSRTITLSRWKVGVRSMVIKHSSAYSKLQQFHGWAEIEQKQPISLIVLPLAASAPGSSLCSCLGKSVWTSKV